VNRPQTRFWLPTWVALVAVVTAFLVVSGAARLGAVQDVGLCSGDTVLVFPDARLLNADGQNIGGPYALELPAGTYTVTAGSYDGHDGTQLSQPQEQWRIAADSGWLSPFTADIADVAQTSITLFSNQIIPADVSSIQLIHLGEGGVNSVSPVCVGFTRVDTGGESGTDTNDSADDSTDVADGSDVDEGQSPGSDEPVEPATDTDDSDAGGDPDTDADADPGSEVSDSEVSGSDDADDPADSADPDVSGDPDDSDADTDSTDTSSDSTDTSSAETNTGGDADGSSDTTTNAPTDGTAGSTAGDETIEPEVAGIVQEADTLAATGAGPFTGRVLGLGMMLLGLGGLVVVLTERRSHLSG